MALFKKKIQVRKQTKILTEGFKLLNNYSPIYTTYDGGLYEMALIRSSIDTIATQCSKLNPVLKGNRNYDYLKQIISVMPNKIMTTQQFLYRLVTILLCENNAYIIPIYKNKFSTEIVGLYPVRANGSRIVKYEDTDYLIYKIENEEYAVEYDRVGHLRRHYYTKEINGENNSALKSTMDLIYTQEEGIKEGIKSGATIRFLARMGIIQNDESIKKEQKRIKEEQLSMENHDGILIFDNKYADVKQVDSKPFIIDKEQMETIRENVFDYFHVSETIIKSIAKEDEWNSFYESVIEPISIQLSQVLTKMIIDPLDIKKGFSIVLESTKLQFMSNNTKLQVSQQLFDRGILSVNQVMDIWNLPHVPEEQDKRYIRKEYTDVLNLDKIPIGGDNDEGNEGGSSTGKNQNGEGNSQE